MPLSKSAASKSGQKKPRVSPSKSKLQEKTLRAAPKTRGRRPHPMEKAKATNRTRVEGERGANPPIHAPLNRGETGTTTTTTTVADTTTTTSRTTTKIRATEGRAVAHDPFSGMDRATVAAAYHGDGRLLHPATGTATPTTPATKLAPPTTRAAEEQGAKGEGEEEEEVAEEEVAEDTTTEEAAGAKENVPQVTTRKYPIPCQHPTPNRNLPPPTNQPIRILC